LGTTWTAISGAATGLPQVPVNAFAVEGNVLFAGTDIGVYFSNNGGANWAPFGFGLPKVAVFDMAFAGAGANRVLRIATHGKGMYQIPAAVPQAILSISGAVTYALDTNKKVGTATLTATSTVGDPQIPPVNSAAGSGTYTLNNLFTYGQYNVVAAKSTQRNGITAGDATIVLRYVASQGNPPNNLSAAQIVAADASGGGGITALDATLILRYVASQAQQSAQTGQVGNWKFAPAINSYNLQVSSLNNENYTATLIGEINNSWNQNGAALPSESEEAGKQVSSRYGASEVELSRGVSLRKENSVTIPVLFANNAGAQISGFNFSVKFDSSVLKPLGAAFDAAGTFSSDCSIAAHTDEAGTIGIAGACPNNVAAGEGALVNLRFAIVGGAQSAKTTLAFAPPPVFDGSNGEVFSAEAVRTVFGASFFPASKR
jgi:hypothetical protein